MRIPEPWQMRAARLQWQTQQSEANRRVKLEARPDAHDRLKAARAKRARKMQQRKEQEQARVSGLLRARYEREFLAWPG